VSKAELHHASDGRMVAMVIRHDFDDFESYPPTFSTAEERGWLQRGYRVASPEVERATKAHLTPDDASLQMTILNRPASAYVKPHYHLNERPPTGQFRHQTMICLSGQARIGVYEYEGAHVADVDLEAGDLVMLCEGHSILSVRDGTRLVEIKQGPMPDEPFGDSVMIESESEPEVGGGR
jgi:hypothetical protein